MSATTEITVPEMPELTFEDSTHTYRLNGIIIPSVSAIMEPISKANYAGIGDRTLSNAADKGSAVHEGIENWLLFGIEDVREEYIGYFQAFLAWWNEYKPVMIGSEIRIYHKMLMYGGTVDFLCLINGKLTLVDFKTTYALSEMSCGVQLEGYAQALESHGIKVEEKRILHLKKDGTYKYHEFPVADARRWMVFGSLQCVYNYIQSYK